MARLAPDDSSLAAARKLAKPGPWSDTGSNESLVWGKCQGSGKTPYQTSVDLNGPAFRCSCPSRKFPCKHGLALLMLWVDGAGTIADVTEAADFAADWAQSRAERAAGATARKTEKKPVDPAAQAKRLEDRLALMDSGIEDFSLWLTDLVRGGTAAARNQPYAWWDSAAARLVDAQVPGLAEHVRTIAGEIHARPDWADHLLAACGDWWTATRAWKGRDGLDAQAMGDLRAVLGWPYATEEIRGSEAIEDTWLTLGAHRTDDGKLQQQRTWFWGETSHQIVHLLDFAARGQTLAVAKMVGSVLQTKVARYPGTGVRRATFIDEPIAVGSRSGLPAGSTIDEAVVSAAVALSTNPWSRRVPVVLDAVQVVATGTAYAVDSDGDALPLTSDAAVWPLLALTGGAATALFGELEHGAFRPLTVCVDGELISL